MSVEMIHPRKNPVEFYDHSRQILPLAMALSVLIPLIGTMVLNDALPDWTAVSLPVHSIFEVAGAAFGLIFALMLLFSRLHRCTTRRLAVVCALFSMSVLDIFHSFVPVSQSFVWMHSLAVLAGGIFFAAAWLPVRDVSRQTALSTTLAVLFGCILIGTLPRLYPDWVPVMIINGAFTPTADVLNLIGGALTLAGGIAFALFYHQRREMENFVFLLLCVLFGTAGMLFQYSDIWHAGWWFWHVLRLSGYLLPLWLAIFVDRMTEEKMIRNQTQLAMAIAEGDFTSDIIPQHDQDVLGTALHSMTTALRKDRQKIENLDWLKTGSSRLDDLMRGSLDLIQLSNRILAELVTRLNAQVGAFYTLDEKTLTLTGSYAYKNRKNLSNRFQLGEGLVGQAALEQQRIVVSDVPENYMAIRSTLIDTAPGFICVLPVLQEDCVLGVVELGSLHAFTDLQMEFLDQAAERIAIALQAAKSRDKLKALLEESQALSEKLQTQQEELKTSNEELEEHTQALQQSEEELKTQQEELQVTNEELEEKTEHLERQRQELIRATQELEKKADELARNSKYKSEFLANMSHELRTPLNSLLILAGTLAENNTGNLTEEQVASAQIIQGSGKDLLSLINEVLDLSKIEAGQMDLHIENVPVDELASDMKRNFQHVVDHKGLTLNIIVEKDAPAVITSDQQRIGQILKNLVSNAVKFTEKGDITVTFSSGKLHRKPCLVFSVKDTGTGIPEDKQKLIFEAFQQAESGTARTYGGTGLGLSISKELARILGGEIRLESTEGKGSLFSVSLPLNTKKETVSQSTESSATARPVEDPALTSAIPNPKFGTIPDDRDSIQDGDTAILVIEDDVSFANVLLKQCRDKGFKGMAAPTGEEGLYLTDKYRPSAIILDIKLPGIDGWSVLDQLKSRIETRHIPVHIMSVEDPAHNARSNGAIGFLKKPVGKAELQVVFSRIEEMLQKKMKNLLVIEDDEKLRNAVLQLIGNGDVLSEGTGSGRDALAKLRSKKYDCIILDLSLPDMTGFQLLKTAEADEEIVLPPVIVYTGRELTRDEEASLIKYSESIIIKGVRSRERLFDEASLFLHRMVETMPEPKRQMIANLHDSDRMLNGKTVLIVDDDMRNLFALSNALSSKGLRTIKAQDGKKALEVLEAESDIDLVLMDIMMPVMDGYETLTRIRAQNRFSRLPIIALTAKAMKDDRRKCIEAGASDYLSKPIDIDRLLSMMRIWMYR